MSAAEWPLSSSRRSRPMWKGGENSQNTARISVAISGPSGDAQASADHKKPHHHSKHPHPPHSSKHHHPHSSKHPHHPHSTKHPHPPHAESAAAVTAETETA